MVSNELKSGISVNTQVPVDASRNSVGAHLSRKGSYSLEKEVTLTGNNETTSDSIVKVIGCVQIVSIFGIVTDATVLNNLTNGYLTIDDGSVQTNISKAVGVSLGGMPLGTVIAKTGNASATLSRADSSNATIIEPNTDKKEFSPFIAIQKTGEDTFIKFTYTTNDSPIDAKISWHILWRKIDGGILEEAE